MLTAKELSHWLGVLEQDLDEVLAFLRAALVRSRCLLIPTIFKCHPVHDIRRAVFDPLRKLGKPLAQRLAQRLRQGRASTCFFERCQIMSRDLTAKNFSRVSSSPDQVQHEVNSAGFLILSALRSGSQECLRVEW